MRCSCRDGRTVAAGPADDRRRHHRGGLARHRGVRFRLAVAAFAFTLLGFGFYTLHASIQVQATELADARGAAM